MPQNCLLSATLPHNAGQSPHTTPKTPHPPSQCELLARAIIENRYAGSPPDANWNLTMKEKHMFTNVIKNGIAVGGGSLLGTTPSLFTATTGIDVFIHEYLGHIVLGGYLMHEHVPGYTPRYHVDGFENFKEIGKAKSFSEAVTAIWHWLSGYDHDHDGAADTLIATQDRQMP